MTADVPIQLDRSAVTSPVTASDPSATPASANSASDSPSPSEPRRAPVLGLTGAVAAGKSTVAKLYRQLGCAVIDVDALGHEVLALADTGSAIATLFGTELRDDAGQLDRDALAAIVFSDEAALRSLEAIVHPRVRARLTARLAELGAAECPPRAVVVDAALLFESGLDALCDETVVVDAASERRRTWARRARGWTDEDVRRREAHQLSADAKRDRATRVLTNDADEIRLRERATALLDEVAPRGDPDDVV